KACGERNVLVYDLGGRSFDISLLNIEGGIFEGIDFYTSLTRAKFEELNQDLFQSTMECVEKVLRDSKIEISQIHEIILVGGSIRIPKIQCMVSEVFNGKELNNLLILMKPWPMVPPFKLQFYLVIHLKKTNDYLLFDVAALSLGIESADGVIIPLIKRNTIVPTKKSEIFQQNLKIKQKYLLTFMKEKVPV
ncbi:962_t:CDS:2, partial [Funneliformis mosseae]